MDYINKKPFTTTTEFKKKYDLRHKDLDDSVIKNFKRDNDFIYYFDYTKKWYKVKIRDAVYIQNIKIAIINYINNLKKGDIIKFNIYMNDYKEKIIKINYKKNKKVSSIKTKNYLIYPEDIYFNKILIREFFFKFYPFFSTVPSMSYRDIQELNNFLNNIDLK